MHTGAHIRAKRKHQQWSHSTSETHLVVFQPLQMKADLISFSVSSDQDVDKSPTHHTVFLLKTGGWKKKGKKRKIETITSKFTALKISALHYPKPVLCLDVNQSTCWVRTCAHSSLSSLSSASNDSWQTGHANPSLTADQRDPPLTIQHGGVLENSSCFCSVAALKSSFLFIEIIAFSAVTWHPGYISRAWW